MLESGVELRDLVYSLIHRRAHLNYRAIISGSNEVELLSNLKAWLEGNPTDKVATGQSPYGSGKPKPVFVFTEMGLSGGAWPKLYRDNPVLSFRGR